MQDTDNSPFQDYPHPDDHTRRPTDTPGFKPFYKKKLSTNVTTDLKKFLVYVLMKIVKKWNVSLDDSNDFSKVPN